MIDAYFEAEDLRSLSLKEKLSHCVLSNGLAEKIRKREEATKNKDNGGNGRRGSNSSGGGGKRKRRRKAPKKSYYSSSSSEDTDDLIEKISFVDQPGEIEGEHHKMTRKQSKITSCKYMQSVVKEGIRLLIF